MDHSMTITNVLEHYGKKGMRWGHRSGSGGLSKSEFKRKIAVGGHEKKRNSKKVSSDKIKSLSDHELRTAINRISMEKQYKSLTNTTSRNEKIGKFITDIGSTAVKSAVTAAATKQVSKALSTAIK